jgi:hypothetical protein
VPNKENLPKLFLPTTTRGGGETDRGLTDVKFQVGMSAAR